ncbi:MAG: ABC transporter ATP-binding protein [Rhodobacterales bacterium]|nr:ABC transporter ATP-binding protein [Rhodobacterales bacterium]MDX5412728.1 ABC transporter ATP-binding protein [Rhodobacterales bacterium]
MIVLDRLTKIFHMGSDKKVVVQNATMTFPSRRSIALLGRNGAGKSTLLRIIAGTIEPTSGQVLSTGTISYPVGFSGSFHRDLTGAQNAKFVARIYGVDTDALLDYVADFAELGPHFHQPIHTYSSGMRSRLAFGISMGIPFDTYLVDEVTSVGDASFRSKSQRVFADRMQESGMLFVSHSLPQVREVCQAGVVLEKGKLTYYEDVEEAIAHHSRNMSD